MDDNQLSTSQENIKLLVGPHQVAIDVTNKCNLRCLHCYNNSGENQVIADELSDDDIRKFVDELADMGIYNICYCGGEPLLRRKLLFECTAKLKEAGVPNISMVTNGLLLTKEVAKEIKESGINRVQISLDGARAVSHDRIRNKKGVYEQAIRAINNLKSVGINANIAFTPTSFNIGEFEDVHALLRGLELYDIDFRLQPLMFMGRASENLKDICPSPEMYRELLKKVYKINKEGIEPHITWGDPVDHLIRFTEQPVCNNQCMIRANGDIVASTYLPLVVGNIRKHTLQEYWEAGLRDIWSFKVVREFGVQIKCIADMEGTNPLYPRVWVDKDIYIDLIDDDLNDLEQLKKYL
ncbi:radical SAM/SPASM domain-containing protein [Cellulosilyticum ruminicola]|uniref:radical SAM/SPASM domain-containing protein n=1 Tax=Cellulosilyticum ruminicola TaxID=425254 RepID=UPI0006CF4A44|nr:radical SAM protein [Cellulosilyticum ruminicola]